VNSPLSATCRKGDAAENLPDLSVVVPVYNEADVVAATLTELLATLGQLAGLSWEVVVVDDGSTDATASCVMAVAQTNRKLRQLRLTPNSGQSAAFWAGFQAARGRIIVTMDGDGQNDPADIPRCLDGLAGVDVCCGYRQQRRDSLAKRWGSRWANHLRRRLLKDEIIDTGCSMKAFKAPLLQTLQYWDGMHRFLPMLAALQGARIHQIPVNHRPRTAGRSKYSNWGRLQRTIRDLQGMRWLQSRTHSFVITEVT
jgi:glycosyltransferase involved in cell wall biosynthesis